MRFVLMLAPLPLLAACVTADNGAAAFGAFVFCRGAGDTTIERPRRAPPGARVPREREEPKP